MAIPVRKIEPPRTPKRMESGTKRIPKFVRQNGLAKLKQKAVTEEVPAQHRDHSFNGTTTRRGRVTPPASSTPSIPFLPEAHVSEVPEASEAPTIPAPSPEAPTPEPTPSEAPLMMSNSAFEELLGVPTPEPIVASLRPPLPPREMRDPRFMALASELARPESVPAPVTKPSRSRTWLAMAGVLLVAGAALFGGAYWAKTASQKQEAPAAAAPKTAPLGPSHARAALASGDLDTARKLFEELAENPSTRMDGLTGLAEVSRAHGDLAGARARYRDILMESPQYFPAKLGEADTTWELGESDAARDQYAALERHSSQALPARVHERAKRH